MDSSGAKCILYKLYKLYKMYKLYTPCKLYKMYKMYTPYKLYALYKLCLTRDPTHTFPAVPSLSTTVIT